MHASTKWVIGETIAAVAAAVLLRVNHYPLLLPYEWHKLLHILGSVIFLGNIIVTAIWMFMAGRTEDPSVIRFASRTTNWADVFFTVPGVFLIFTNGDIMSSKWGGIFHTSWIAASLGLFVLSGILWVGLLLRYQNRLIVLSDMKLETNFYPVLHKWLISGAVAIILPLAALALMVLQPGIW